MYIKNKTFLTSYTSASSKPSKITKSLKSTNLRKSEN